MSRDKVKSAKKSDFVADLTKGAAAEGLTLPQRCQVSGADANSEIQKEF